MAFHDILSKCDRALVAYLISKGAGTVADTFPGKRSLTKQLPCTICFSDSATPPEGLCYTGTFTVQAVIMVKSAAPIEDGQAEDDPSIAASARIKPIYDAFFFTETSAGDTLGEDITTAARATGDADLQNLTILNCEVKHITAGTNPRSPLIAQGNAWIDALHIELLACPSDVS